MRIRVIGTVQVQLAVGAGMFTFRWQPVKGQGAGGAILWLGPLGIGGHLIAVDADAVPPDPTVEKKPPSVTR